MESMKEALEAMLEEIPDYNEDVVMNGVKEEDIIEMIQSLMTGDALLEQNHEIEVIQIDDDEDNVMVQENCFSESLDTKYWWEAYALASGGENYTEYNWCFEDDLKMWEWSDYFKMPELIEPKAASEASEN